MGPDRYFHGIEYDKNLEIEKEIDRCTQTRIIGMVEIYSSEPKFIYLLRA